MAYLRPAEAEKFQMLATWHQNLALPLFRSALTNVTESNCHALYACGHLVTKYHFARPLSREMLLFSSGIEGISEIFIVLRGAFSIHDYAHEWIVNGPLGFCLEKPLETDPDLSLNPDDSHLAQLMAILLTNSCEDTNICCGALNTLRSLFAIAATPNQTISAKTLAYSWPMQVPERFIALVGLKKPEALLVLAHYSVLLKMIDHFWFMEGCAAGILKQCQQNLASKWHQYLEWPLQFVGLGLTKTYKEAS